MSSLPGSVTSITKSFLDQVLTVDPTQPSHLACRRLPWRRLIDWPWPAPAKGVPIAEGRVVPDRIVRVTRLGGFIRPNRAR